MIVHNVQQGEDEWMRIRAGLPTASCFDKIVTMAGKPSAQRQKYLYQLAGERITGTKEPTYQNQWMSRGIELEAEARSAYEFLYDAEVETVGICTTDDGRWGASPDGLEPERGIEIKCPSMAVHVEYLLGKKLPSQYFQQVHGQMAVCEKNAWRFISYYPGMPMLVVDVEPDVKFQKALNAELEAFAHELDAITEQLRRAA